jgi:hypothetical protein
MQTFARPIIVLATMLMLGCEYLDRAASRRVGCIEPQLGRISVLPAGVRV